MSVCFSEAEVSWWKVWRSEEDTVLIWTEGGEETNGGEQSDAFSLSLLLDFTSIKHNSDCQGRHGRITSKVVLNIRSFLTTPRGEGARQMAISVSPLVDPSNTSVPSVSSRQLLR